MDAAMNLAVVITGTSGAVFGRVCGRPGRVFACSVGPGVVPTGLDSNRGEPHPTLKRGANKHCASGACGVGRSAMQASQQFGSVGGEDKSTVLAASGTRLSALQTEGGDNQ
jgi:hypothetical protein